VAERGQTGAGPDRADHEARAAIARHAVDRFAGQLGAAAIDLERPMGQLELAERDRRAAERVGLDGIRAGAQIAEVNVRDHVWAGEVEHLGAVLLAPEVGLDREVARMDLGAHGTVEQQHAALQGLEKIRHGDSGRARLRPRRAGPGARRAGGTRQW
jgi:hypothetical protein